MAITTGFGKTRPNDNQPIGRQDPIVDALDIDSVLATTDYTFPTGISGRAIYIGVAGNVTVTMVSGIDVALTNLAVGVWHPIEYTVVKKVGTTATGVVVGA